MWKDKKRLKKTLAVQTSLSGEIGRVQKKLESKFILRTVPSAKKNVLWLPDHRNSEDLDGTDDISGIEQCCGRIVIFDDMLH